MADQIVSAIVTADNLVRKISYLVARVLWDCFLLLL